MTFSFDDIKKIVKEIKLRPIRTIVILLILVILAIIVFYSQGYFTEKGKQAVKNPNKIMPANSQTLGDQSPIITTGSNSKVLISYDAKEKNSNSENMPVLIAKPISFEPYTPSPPQVPGQFKANIVVALILKNNKIANNIRIKFDIDDGAGRRVDSEEWDIIANQKPLIFSMAYPDIKQLSWTPDIPNAIKEIAQNRAKPFILRLLVSWEDMKGEKYRLISYSELRYNESTNVYYFDERENKYL